MTPAARRRAALLCAACLCLLPAPALAATGAAPAAAAPLSRFALIIGSNDGGGGRVKLRFAGSDARAVARVLGQMGGLSSGDQILLLEPRREQVLSALSELGRRVDAARGQSKRTEVIVYYSGHSDDQGLLPAGEPLAYSELRAAIDRLGADVRVAILDSCSAGAFTRKKGGVFRAPFLVDDSVKVRGHAFLASSSINEAAQESERIRGSFFTHFLVTGLRGAADVSGDGRVTLNEAYNFAFRETLAGTEKTIAGAQHPAYDIEMAGTGDLVMTDLHQLSAGLTLPAELAGRIYLRDASGALAAELGKSAGGSVELGLDPGAYRVVLDQGGKLYQADVVVDAGRSTVLTLAQLVAAQPEAVVRRGPEPAPAGPRPVAFNFSLVPPLSTNSVFRGPVKNALSLSLVASYSYGLGGAALSPVWSAVGGDASGLVASGVGAWVGGDLRGAALSGVTNLVGGRGRGLLDAGVLNLVVGDFSGLAAAGVGNVQLQEASALLAAGVFNYVGDDGRGLEVAGVANINRGDFSGLQIASVVNVSGDLSGAQLGLINRAATVRGLQLGLINVADSVDRGAPIGLISVVRHGGMHSLELAATDSMPLSLMLKLGSRTVFTILGAGIDPFRETTRWSGSVGLGVARPIGRFFLEGDLLAGGVQLDIRQFDTRGPDLLTELRLLAGYQILPALAVMVGLSAHVSVAPRRQPSYSALSGLESVYTSGDTAVRLGPGFVIGVRAL